MTLKKNKTFLGNSNSRNRVILLESIVASFKNNTKDRFIKDNQE